MSTIPNSISTVVSVENYALISKLDNLVQQLSTNPDVSLSRAVEVIKQSIDHLNSTTLATTTVPQSSQENENLESVLHSSTNKPKDESHHAQYTGDDKSQGWFKCPICQTVYTDWPDFNHHLSTGHNPSTSRICELCQGIFVNQACYAVHECVLPYSEPPMPIFIKRKCGLCQSSTFLFASFDAFNRHKTLMHAKKNDLTPFTSVFSATPIPESGEEYINKRIPVPRINDRRNKFGEYRRPRIHRKSNFACDSCPSVFRLHSQLRSHYVFRHGRILPSIRPQSYDEQPYDDDNTTSSRQTTSPQTNQDADEPSPSSSRMPFPISSSKKTARQGRKKRLLPVSSSSTIPVTQTSNNINASTSRNNPPSPSNVCPSCNETFTTRNSLLRHYRVKHRRTMSHYNQCRYCPYQSRDRTNLSVHVARHFGIKKFACELCDARFMVRRDLLDHKAFKHAASPTYSCPYCQKTFKTPGILSRHRIVHERGKRFVCSQCNSQFARLSNLKRHEKSHLRQRVPPRSKARRDGAIDRPSASQPNNLQPVAEGSSQNLIVGHHSSGYTGRVAAPDTVTASTESSMAGESPCQRDKSIQNWLGQVESTLSTALIVTSNDKSQNQLEVVPLATTPSESTSAPSSYWSNAAKTTSSSSYYSPTDLSVDGGGPTTGGNTTRSGSDSNPLNPHFFDPVVTSPTPTIDPTPLQSPLLCHFSTMLNNAYAALGASPSGASLNWSSILVQSPAASSSGPVNRQHYLVLTPQHSFNSDHGLAPSTSIASVFGGGGGGSIGTLSPGILTPILNQLQPISSGSTTPRLVRDSPFLLHYNQPQSTTITSTAVSCSSASGVSRSDSAIAMSNILNSPSTWSSFNIQQVLTNPSGPSQTDSTTNSNQNNE